MRISKRGLIFVDYLLTGTIILVAYMFNSLTPIARPFDPSDTSISLPHNHSTVPGWMLVLLSTILPAAIVVVGAAFSRSEGKRKLWEAHCALLGLLLSIAITMIITDGLKNAIGRPRPDMLARCQPDPALFKDHMIPGTQLVTIGVCTGKDQGFHGVLRDGFRSFPSGHSSISFAGLTYLSFFILAKTRAFDHRGYVFKYLLALLPLLLAGWVACSRITDFRHHPFDVMFGSAIGIGAAFFSFSQYFSFKSGKAYAVRWEERQQESTSLMVDDDAERDG